MQRLLYLFSVAGLVASVVTLIGYLASRGTSFAPFYDHDWDLILLATGAVVLGLLVIAAGVAVFYSVDGAFMLWAVLISMAIVAGGAALVYLGVMVILDAARAFSA